MDLPFYNRLVYNRGHRRRLAVSLHCAMLRAGVWENFAEVLFPLSQRADTVAVEDAPETIEVRMPDDADEMADSDEEPDEAVQLTGRSVG